MRQLARGCALGAMRTHVDGALEYWLLANPHAVLHLCPNRATHRAERTNRFQALDVARAHRIAWSLRADTARRAKCYARKTSNRRKTRSLQEAPAGVAALNLRRCPGKLHRAGRQALSL